MDKPLDFKTAFKYPFNRPKGLLIILWVLVPIIGWFILMGYGIRIIQEFLKGKFKEVPLLKVSSDLKLGFFLFLKIIPFIIVVMLLTTALSKIQGIGPIINILLQLFVYPILGINFAKKMTISSLFEINLVRIVFNNASDYIIVILKSLLLGIIFFLMIIILIGFPAQSFTENIFFADFYRRNVKEKKN